MREPDRRPTDGILAGDLGGTKTVLALFDPDGLGLRMRVAVPFESRRHATFEEIIERCRELNLRLMDSEESTKTDFLVFLTVQTMNYLHSGRHRVAL